MYESLSFECPAAFAQKLPITDEEKDRIHYEYDLKSMRQFC